MAILVTGGAGYIGSHTVKYLQEKGEEIVVVDNLQSGHREAINIEHFYNVDIRDKDLLDNVFKNHYIEAVIHFAASSLVEDSMKDPYSYYSNNVCGTLTLLETMRNNRVDKIVFSSSAAVYGEPKQEYVREDHDTLPSNTYGETKLVIEKMMKWFDIAHEIKYVSLRYFNAAGASESGHIGEDHSPETHLIPILLQVPLGKRDKVYIFGEDYSTKDGTCIRDYVHVMDLAAAHYLALEYLRNYRKSDTFNLGNGRGYSVKEVLETVEKVTKCQMKYEVRARRNGDPSVLVAYSEKAMNGLGWKPEFSSLEKIIKDAWSWHKKNPDGYNK